MSKSDSDSRDTQLLSSEDFKNKLSIALREEIYREKWENEIENQLGCCSNSKVDKRFLVYIAQFVISCSVLGFAMTCLFKNKQTETMSALISSILSFWISLGVNSASQSR